MRQITEISVLEMEAIDKLSEFVARNPSPCEVGDQNKCEYVLCDLFNCKNCKNCYLKEQYDEKIQKQIDKLPVDYLETYKYLKEIGYFKAEVERKRADRELQKARALSNQKTLLITKVLKDNDILIKELKM